MSAPPAPLLACRRLEVGYDTPILPPIDLEIRPGELWAIVGSNGSGKSTWMRTALGLEPPVRGEVSLAPGLQVAYVPQAAALDPIFPVRVHDVVAMGTLRKGAVGGLGGRALKRAVSQALGRAHAEGLIDRPFRDLSGGQKQRVLIARALASGAQLFFLDEPTSALDRQAEQQILGLIDDLRKAPGCAVALVTHHLQVLRDSADFALLLDRQPPLAVAGKSSDVVQSEGFRRLYGEVRAP